MKKMKLFVLLLGLILIILSGCNLNRIDQPSDEITVEFGTDLPPEIEALQNSETKAPGWDWVGWYDACLDPPEIDRIWVYPIYNSTDKYAVVNYMYDEDYNFLYWVKAYGFSSDVPYEGFNFEYYAYGQRRKLEYYTQDSIRRVRHYRWVTTTQAEWYRYNQR